ncbi:hypothetical protein D1R32_gp351 [Tunisvirus fontaine2]|uniref:Uncharacterized protein n=1 Tax=Tunisvirus fontaine2 TaxID=1421067 RepID=V9SDU6_9VIRU|nr:hypothetical protein D1R32_gp351 [Tunisvirus fontaine2]AHC55068.1 hypothetical protein TNS_ORF350 [Tunisvirus fontaine2]
MTRLALSLFSFGVFVTFLFALLANKTFLNSSSSLELLFVTLLFSVIYTSFAGLGYACVSFRKTQSEQLS